MAKLSIINREIKRRRLVEKFRSKREALLLVARSVNSSDEEKMDARLKLQGISFNASPVRLRNRCFITGRPRGVFRRFGICRHKIREISMNGGIPGITKASW